MCCFHQRLVKLYSSNIVKKRRKEEEHPVTCVKTLTVCFRNVRTGMTVPMWDCKGRFIVSDFKNCTIQSVGLGDKLILSINQIFCFAEM